MRNALVSWPRRSLAALAAVMCDFASRTLFERNDRSARCITPIASPFGADHVEGKLRVDAVGAHSGSISIWTRDGGRAVVVW